MSTRLFSLACLAALLAGSSARAQNDDDYPRREAVEFRERGGIPNVLKKLRAGGDDEIRIGYLGGSITAAPGWRVKSLAWLQERFPEAKLAEINAAIGGTGSDLGVFRCQQDVLRHQPDLLFVEFAVNDGGAAPKQIHQAMEGIVRQTWAANPETDIIFVYTLSQPFLEDLQAGKFSRSASAMEEVADHYGIPTIHLGMEVAKREAAGSLIFKGEKGAKDVAPESGAPMVFSTDGVHPLVETGHQLYLEAIARSWEKLEAAPKAEAAVPHALIDPLRADHWASAKLVPITPTMLTGDWEKLDNGESGDSLAKRFAKLMPEMWRASKPGNAVTLRFRGTVAGFYDLVGPDGGQLKVKLDDEEERIVRRIDGYCTYHRLSKFQVGSGLDPDVVHSVTVTLDSESPDKAKILFEHNLADLEMNPDKYAKSVWNVGSIMLIGDVVD